MRHQRLAVYVAVAGISSASVALLAARMNTPLTYDEAFSWKLSQYPFSHIIRVTSYDVHPPLYYILLRMWASVFGPTPSGLRSMSLVTSAMIPFVTALAYNEAVISFHREAVPSDLPSRGRAGSVVAALLVIHPFQLTFATNARMYALATLLASLSTFLMFRAVNVRSASSWALYVAAAAAMNYTHNYGLFTFAAQLAVLGILGLRGSVGAGVALGAAFSVASLYAPWVPSLISQAAEVGRGFWIPSPEARMAMDTFSYWSLGLGHLRTPEFCCWVVFLALLGCFACWARAWESLAFAIMAALPWLLSLTVSVATGRSIFLERCLTLGYPFMPCFLVAGITSMPYSRLRLVCTLLIVGLFADAVLEVRTLDPDRDHVSSSSVARIVEGFRAKSLRGDVILAPTPATWLMLEYQFMMDNIYNVKVLCLTKATLSGRHVTHLAAVPVENRLADGSVLHGERRIWVFSPYPYSSSSFWEVFPWVTWGYEGTEEVVAHGVQDRDLQTVGLRLYEQTRQGDIDAHGGRSGRLRGAAAGKR